MRRGLALVAAFLLAGCQQAVPPAAPRAATSPEAEPSRQGVALDRVLPPFTLTSHTGRPLALADLRGRVVLLAFGYTHCPDACPITLAQLVKVKDRLGERAASAAFVFVSVDGERDTPEVLGRYVGHFDPAFIGLTGDDAALRPLAPAFGLYYEVRQTPGSAAGYTVDHTVATYLIDRAGRLRYVYPFGTSPAEIVRDALTVLDQGAGRPGT